MPTKWVVTTPSDRIELDESQQGQLTFTVTNPTARIDRVAFDILPQEGADASWFTVDEPQRRVPAGGSVSYVMKAVIPQSAKPGSYSVQGRAYSADSAPEEDSVLSSRVALQLKPKAAPAPRKPFPWWIVVVAALVVIVLVVVVVLVSTGGKTPSATPATPVGEQVTMPDLANQSGQQATTNINAFGLTVGTVRYVQDARPGRIVYQSVPGGAKVAKGTKVDLVATTALAKPAITAPANGATIAAAALSPVKPVPTTPALNASSAPSAPSAPASSAPAPPGVLTWTDSDPFVRQWQVTIYQQLCIESPYGSGCGTFVITMQVRVDRPSATPVLPAGMAAGAPPFYVMRSTNVYSFTIQPVDDFGNAGPASDPHTFTVV